MRTIVHLSDLHFGRTDDALLTPLASVIAKLAPDLIAVSGDLTQRARTAEFQAARAFLDRLPKPQIIVPGNHDVPLHNVFTRFIATARPSIGVTSPTISSRSTPTTRSRSSGSIPRAR